MVLRDLESFCLGNRELDDALEASITTLASDEFLTKYLITVPISLLGFAMFFARVLCKYLKVVISVAKFYMHC